MTENSPDLLALIDRCSEVELDENLSVLKSDLKSTNENIDWLPQFTSKVEKFGDVTKLNLYERIRMHIEVRKLLPMIAKLNSDLIDVVKSTREFCPNFKFDFSADLKNNVVRHSSSCNACKNPPVKEEITVEEVPQKSDIEKQISEYYPTHTVNMARSLDDSDVPTLRQLPRAVECLLCKCRFSIAKNQSCITDHLRGKKHRTKLSMEGKYLTKFHEFWNRQPLDAWKKHLQFTYTFDRMQCKACSRTLNYAAVSDHLDDCSQLVERNAVELEEPQITNAASKEDTPRCVNRDDEKAIFQSRDDRTICVICDSTVDGDRQQHLDGKLHRELAVVERAKACLNLYQDVWSCVPKLLLEWRKHFRRGVHNMTCTLCNGQIAYNVETLLKHFTVRKHRKCVEGNAAMKCADIAREALRQRKQANVFQPSIVYRGMPFLKIGDEMFPTAQRLPAGYYGSSCICLVCNETLEKRQQAGRHATSVPHLARQADKVVQYSLALYHKVFEALPKSLQLKQTHFERGVDQFRCKFCETSVPYDPEALRKHLERVPHPGRGDIREGLKRAFQAKQSRVAASRQDRKTRLQREREYINDTTDLNNQAQEPPEKRVKVEEATTIQAPGYVYFDYSAPDFIPLSVKTEPED